MKAKGKPAHYDPRTGSASHGTTVYEDFHEEAHAEQHSRRTLAWRWRETFFHIPILNVAANWIVEAEAMLMALGSMQDCKVLRGKDIREAIKSCASYWKSLFDWRLILAIWRGIKP